MGSAAFAFSWRCGEKPWPSRTSYAPRGELDMFGGLTHATSARTQSCLDGFASWLHEHGGAPLDDTLATAESCNLALSACGKALFA